MSSGINERLSIWKLAITNSISPSQLGCIIGFKSVMDHKFSKMYIPPEFLISHHCGAHPVSKKKNGRYDLQKSAFSN